MARSTVLAQHALFQAIGVRVRAIESPGEMGPVHRLKWDFVERHGPQSYGAFSEALGLQTEATDLVALVQTLAGERGELATELKRRGVYKRLALRYQPDDGRWAFWLRADLRDGDRRFQGYTGLSEYDALRIMWCATRVLAGEVGASPRDMLDYALRVGSRRPPATGGDDEQHGHNQRRAIADAG